MGNCIFISQKKGSFELFESLGKEEPPQKRHSDSFASGAKMLSYAESQAELRALAVQDPSAKLHIPVYESNDLLCQTKFSPPASMSERVLAGIEVSIVHARMFDTSWVSIPQR